jgi:hypothetical protein
VPIWHKTSNNAQIFLQRINTDDTHVTIATKIPLMIMLVATLQLNTGMIFCRYVDEETSSTVQNTHLDPKIWKDLKSRVFSFLNIHITTLQQEVKQLNMAAACTIAQLTDYSASCGACDLGSLIINITGITTGTYPHHHQMANTMLAETKVMLVLFQRFCS